MRNANPAYLIDWIAVTLRWLVLLGLAVSLSTDRQFSTLLVITFLSLALWNVILTWFVVLNRRFSLQGPLSVTADLLVAYLLFYQSGALAGDLGWAGILPLISGSLYFQIRGALSITVINLLVQSALALTASTFEAVLLMDGLLLPLYLGLGLIISYLSRRMELYSASIQKTQLAARREAEKAERERRRVIYNLISALSASLNYQRVLDTALDLSSSALLTSNASPDQLVSAVLLYSASENNGTELRIGSARRFTPADMRIAIPGTTGLIGRTIDEGGPRLSKDVVQDPELGRFVALRACKAAYCIPLRSGLDTYGVIVFASPEAEFFTPDQCEILDIIGNQSVIAIQNARLYQDLELEKERMMEIQEEARKKMARDLHDGPTQSVAAIAMRVNFARRLMERDAKAAGDELFKIEDLARRTTKEIRHMLFTLRPLVLESQGLIAALESMAEKMRETYNQNVIIQADKRIIEELEAGKQAVAFYIAEEAVTNARKHAKAKHIWVRLKPLQPDLALLEIEDDGAGFNTKAVDSSYENRGSLGMVNMRERTELVNGVLQIHSEEGRGTRIRVLIPLTEEAADRIRHGL